MFCINQSRILLKPVDNCVNPVNPSRPNPGQREKIKLNFFSHFFVAAQEVGK